MMAYQIIWIISILTVTKGQTLPEGKPDRTTACAGTILRGSCPANESIAVKDVQYGTKLTATCGQSNTSAGCCDYDAGDCFQPSYTDTAQQAACTGRTLCKEVTVGQADTTSCLTGYPSLNHYLTMQYYCVPESRIFSMCSSVTKNSTGSLLYLQNRDYTSPVRADDLSCSCSVETPSCSSYVNVYFIHFQLADGSGSCTGTQRIVIADKDALITFSCDNNTDFTITLKLRSTSNYLNITLENNNGINDGHFWLGFEGTDITVPLKVECPAVSQTICMDCPAVVNITNGTVSTPGGLSTGQNAIYSCDPGFNLLGNDTRTCLENGAWSGDVPICQIKECPGLSSPANGNVSTVDGITVGQTATYECNYGYEIQGVKSRICQVNTTWSDDEPSCIEIECPGLDNPEHGNVSTGGDFTVGQNAIYTCNYGYELDGDASMTCQLNATWSGNEPTCIEIVCPSLPAPANGSVTTAGGDSVGQTANYSCNVGYQLNRNAIRTCQQNGAWSGSSPECVERTCPALTNPINGAVSTDSVLIGSRAVYSCSVGYILTGMDARTCQNNYTWSGSSPVCTARVLGDTCTTEEDCTNVISWATCNGTICVCAEGGSAKGCDRPGEAEDPGDDHDDLALIIGLVGGFVCLIIIIIVIVCCFRYRKRGQSNDDTDKEKLETVQNSQELNMRGQSNDDTDKYKQENTANKEKLETVQNSQELNMVNETPNSNGEIKHEHSIEMANQGDTRKAEDKSEENKSKDENKPPEFENIERLDDNEVGYLTSGENILAEVISREDNEDTNDDRSDPQKEVETDRIEDEAQDKIIEETNPPDPETENSEGPTNVTIETIEQEIQEADLKLNFNEQFLEMAKRIKDETAALFRSASVAKRDLIAQRKAGDSFPIFDTAEDGEWSNGLIAAATKVLSAIYAMCGIANDMAHGKADEAMMIAAGKVVKTATNALVILYKIEGHTESEAMKYLKKARAAVNSAAEDLVSSAQETQPKARKTKKMNVTVDEGNVQNAIREMERVAKIVKAEHELEEAQKATVKSDEDKRLSKEPLKAQQATQRLSQEQHKPVKPHDDNMSSMETHGTVKAVHLQNQTQYRADNSHGLLRNSPETHQAVEHFNQDQSDLQSTDDSSNLTTTL